VVIRRGARALGLKTDASYRFERGMDAEATVPALKMALHLLSRSQGRRLAPAFFQDVYPGRRPPQAILLDKDFPGRLTGIDIPAATGWTPAAGRTSSRRSSASTATSTCAA
jgi:phenylalanyl-tRNA synthetase beta chain